MGRVIEGTRRPLRGGNLRGLFLSSQKVPADVLVEVLVEMLVDFVPNSPRKSYPDLKSANTLSVLNQSMLSEWAI